MDYVKSGTSAIPDLKFKGLKRKSHAVALTDIGFANLQKNDLDIAQMYFTQALKIDPQNAPAMLNLGALAEKQGNPEEAVKAYRQVLALKPESSDDEKESLEAKRSLDAAKALATENLERLSVEQSVAPEGGTEMMEQGPAL